MIYSIIRKPGPIQLPTGHTGSGSGSGTSTGTCTTYPCPDVLVPGYNNAGNDGGTPIPGTAVTTTPAAQVGTGMDMEKTTGMWEELTTLFVPGVALAVLALILYLSSKKS